MSIIHAHGYLVRDAETTTTKNGKEVTSFTIADNQGKDKKPIWLKVVCWEKKAEFAQRFAFKGALCIVSGQLKINEYEGNDGKMRTSVEIWADSTNFPPCGKSRDEQQPSQSSTGRDDEARNDNSDVPF